MSPSSTAPNRPMADVADHEMQWVQPKLLKRHYDLLAGADLIAALDFRRGTLADAASQSESWTFKREGFWHPRVTVRALGSETNRALFGPHWGGGGELRTKDGRTYTLKVASFWHSEWQWQEQDRILVNFKRPAGLLKSDCVVDVPPDGRRLPDLALLVTLGWYLMVLYAQDMAIVTAAGAAAR